MVPKDFFRVAGRLLQHGDGPCCRSVVSRAYYGLFHSAVEAMKPHGIKVPDSPDGHAVAARLLQNCGDPGIMMIGSQLDSFRTMRNGADYKLAETKTEDRPTADMWLKKAKNHSATLEKAFGGPQAATLVAGIQAYEAKIRPAPPPRPNMA